MFFIKRSELRGILILILVVLVIAGLLAVMGGKLETWFGITIGGGPRLYDKILFVSGKSGSNEVYVADPDGSNVRQLTTGAQAISTPFVSPNGSRVVFVGRTGRSSEVFLVRGAGGEPERLTSTTGPKAMPQYNSDGAQLAFLSGGTVYVSDMDGGNVQPMLPTRKETDEAIVRRDPMPAYRAFAWTPDGKGMVGVVEDPNVGDVLAYLPRLGSKSQRIAIPAPERVSINSICWAREQPSLAVTAVYGKHSIAALFDLDEKSARGIADSTDERITDIALSPDASRVAVSVVAPKNSARSGIRTFNLTTGEGVALLQGEYENLQYSPSGGLLAAQVNLAGGGTDIIVIDTDSGDVTRLTDDGNSFAPTWSPAAQK